MSERHAREAENSPYRKGEEAACIGLAESANPHPADSTEFYDWLAGFRDWITEWDPQLNEIRI